MEVDTGVRKSGGKSRYLRTTASSGRFQSVFRYGGYLIDSG